VDAPHAGLPLGVKNTIAATAAITPQFPVHKTLNPKPSYCVHILINMALDSSLLDVVGVHACYINHS